MPSKSSKKALMQARRAKVAAMLQNGFPQRQMAAALGVSAATINRDIKALVAEWRNTQANESDAAMQVDLQRLDQMLVAVYSRAKGGEIQAINTVMAILDRRRQIYGYAAPKRISVETSEPITLVEVVLTEDEDAAPNEPAGEDNPSTE